MSCTESKLGMYGKIPILGDFVSRGLPTDFIQFWDAWLQDSISKSQQILGTGWLDIFLTSPIWRFMLSPGVCGEKAWAGVLIPSVDRVGRYFPLTLAASVPEDTAIPRLLDQAGEWFEAVEQMALSGLQNDFDMTQFDEGRHRLGFPATGPHFGSQNNLHGGLYVEVGTMGGTVQALANLSSGLMNRFMAEYSMWGTVGSEHVSPCLRVYEPMPPASAYSTFLTDGTDIKRENSIEPN